MSVRGSSSSWSILFVVFVFAGALLWGLWPKGKSFEQATGLGSVKEWNEIKSEIDGIKNQASSRLSGRDEEIAIDQWIIDEGLNEYGDEFGTMYIGGTPLFDERTGKTIDRYEYIKMRHPDKPWKD